MPLMLKPKAVSAKPVVVIAKTEKKKRPFCPRFNMVMPIPEREALHKVAEDYGKELGITVPAAFIVRMGLEEILPKMRADLQKAANGRYHAKIRKEFSHV